MKYILGIETSCDDTACAVMREDFMIVSNILSSQREFHAKYGGIVPEIASRKHLELISIVMDEALCSAGINQNDINLITVTNGPGLVGSLLIGVDYAKTLSLVSEKPIIGVNHLEGHLLSPLIIHPGIEFPFLGIIVSGGHTEFYLVKEIGSYQKVAETVDDACGEALDKFGKAIGIRYPAGPEIERLAEKGSENRFVFTMPKVRNKPFALSFSGLKTASIDLIKKMNPEELNHNIPDLCSSFQSILFKQILRIIKKLLLIHNVNCVVVSGGVSANMYLKKLVSENVSIPVYFPTNILSTDNAGMIAFAGFKKYLIRGEDSLDLPVVSRLTLT